MESTRVVYDRKKQDYFIRLIDGFIEGIIAFPPFFAAWCTGYHGLEINESELIDIRFSSNSEWLSIEQARDSIKEVQGGISIEIRLRRDEDGNSGILSELSIGYLVQGSIVSYLNTIALPSLLEKPTELQRIVKAIDSPIESVNPARIIQQSIKPLDDRFLINFKYTPSAIATQGEFQGDEVPAILIRLESQTNKREMGIPQYMRNSPDTSIRTEYAYSCDLVFEVSVIAQKTQDVTAIVDHLFSVVSDRRINLPPFGLCFGLSISGQIAYDNPIRESDLAGLPTASFSLVIHNVPVGQTSNEVDLITKILPVVRV